MTHQRIALPLLLSLMLASPPLAGPTIDRIQSSGVLRVGTTGDYKPFTVRNPDGTYTGSDMVMARRLAQKIESKG
jgi:cyclohexadienyl dehydratase